MFKDFEVEDKEQYTKEDIQKIVSELQERANTETKILSEKVIDIDKVIENNKELAQKNLALKNGITDDDILQFVIDDDLEKMQSKIDKFKEISEKNKVDKDIEKSYKPTEKRNEDQYQKALKDGNVESALKYKFGKLFTK